MPKKTKREKILAEQHRKTQELVVSPPSSDEVILPIHKTTNSQYTFQAASESIKPVNQENNAEYRAIKIDLVKTLMLAAAAISMELLLYLKIGR